jgi:hypothetical protein
MPFVIEGDHDGIIERCLVHNNNNIWDSVSWDTIVVTEEEE